MLKIGEKLQKLHVDQSFQSSGEKLYACNGSVVLTNVGSKLNFLSEGKTKN